MYCLEKADKRGGVVAMYIKDSMQAYEVRNVRYRHKKSTFTMELMYRSSNLRKEDDIKMHNTIKDITKRECILMGDVNHGHIQLKSLENVGRDYASELEMVSD